MSNRRRTLALAAAICAAFALFAYGALRHIGHALWGVVD